MDQKNDIKMGKKSGKRMSTKKTIIISAASAVGVAALVIIGLFIYKTVINPSAAFSLIVTQQTPAPGDDDTAQQAQATVAPGLMEGRVNILVMGMDSSEERMETEREDFRTDTMLLVTINFNTGKVDMITTPRDSYVEVKNATGELYKVNSAAYFGGGLCDKGFKNACDTISGVFGGIPVPYYVGVDMDGLKALVDAMDGVDYNMDLDYTGDSGQVYKKGMQHLDSTQVLDYLRLRKGYGKDVDRQQRQRKMMIAIFKQLAKSGQMEKLPDIYKSLSDMVYTNLSFEQICALAAFGSNFDDWSQIGQYTLPGEYHTAYGVYFYLLDQQGKADLVKKVFGADIGIDEKHDINYVLDRSPDSGTSSDDEENADTEDGDSATPKPTSSAKVTPSPTDTSSADPEPSEKPSATSEPASTPAPATSSDSEAETE